MKIKYFFFLLINLILSHVSIAQILNVNDINGKSILATKYINISGSPFLTDNWLKGSVKLSDGRTYSDLFLKYDLVEDALYFKGKNAESMAITEPIQEFNLQDIISNNTIKRTFRNGFPDTKGSTSFSFYEILVDNKTSLLKRSKKSIIEMKEYSSATVNKNINESVNYYLLNSNKLTLIKKDSKSILSALEDKKLLVEGFIKTNKLNLKNEEDLIKLINYYNAL